MPGVRITQALRGLAGSVGLIVDADVDAAAAIAKTKIAGTAVTVADTGTVTSAMILDGTIVNVDIGNAAAIDPRKLSLPIEYYLSGSNRNIKYNVDRRTATNTTLAALTTQIMSSFAIFLEAGQVVTSISFRSGTTALSVGSNWWFALYDNQATPALLSQTADQTTTAWGASTIKTLALSTNGGAQTITTSGIYYCSVMVNATTVPTLTGPVGLAATTISSGMAGSQPVLAQTSGSALTTTAPPTITAGTAISTLAICQVS